MHLSSDKKSIVGSVAHAAELNWKWVLLCTRSVLWPRMCRKCVCGRGFAPDPNGGAYDAPPDPLVGWGGVTPHKAHPIRWLRRLEALDPRASGARVCPPVHIISVYATDEMWRSPALVILSAYWVKSADSCCSEAAWTCLTVNWIPPPARCMSKYVAPANYIHSIMPWWHVKWNYFIIISAFVDVRPK